MESIFFRRLEPRRSTQAILPNVSSVGGFGNMNPQYATQYTVPAYGNIVGSCPRIDSPGLQSVVGTLGDVFNRGSMYNAGQYNIGTYNWGGYNMGMGNFMGSCPDIDSPGLQSVVGSLGNIFKGGFSVGQYNAPSYGIGSMFAPGGCSYINMGCYDYGWNPMCLDFGYIGGGCAYIGGTTCFYVSGGCGYISGGGGCSYIGDIGCLGVGGGCGYIGCGYIGGGGCGYIGCPSFGGCTFMDPSPLTSILGTLDSFGQY